MRDLGTGWRLLLAPKKQLGSPSPSQRITPEIGIVNCAGPSGMPVANRKK
jgi:hypothetical protein